MGSKGNASDWDHSVDLLVVGSGSGAMTAGIMAADAGAKTLLIEKSDRYGGSSAMSGGGLWVPNNHLMAGAGIEDSPAEALAYLKGTTAGAVPEDKLRAYLDAAPEMVEYLSKNSRAEFVALPEYADYYPAVEGSKPGARSIEPASFHAGQLGEEFLKMREQNIQMLIMGRIFMTVLEARTLLTKAKGWIGLTMKLMARYWLDLPWRFKSKRDRNVAMGNALMGMLRRSLMDRNVPLWLNTAARKLIVEKGRVIGVVVDKQGRSMRIRTKRGVVMAAGGFESNQEMREKYLPKPTRAQWTCANPHSKGDAIAMGLEIGASLEFMDDAWWGPTTLVEGEEHARMLVIEKSLPGSITVNKKGERFVNEAAPYIDVVNAMYANHSEESPSVPAYMVFDATFRKNYPFGPLLQGTQQPDSRLPKHLKHYLKKADTIEGLAAQLGVDPAGLKATIERFNGYARSGTDEDFHRGETVFDRYYGDEKVKPNPCLAPLDTAPFYGIEAYPGELGTKGGLKTDARARVLDEKGEPIAGLYASGNCSGSVMGHTYPGAGATIGPSMTFAYIAVRDALAQ